MTKLFFHCSKIVVIVSVLIILLARFIAISRATDSQFLAYTLRNYNDSSLMLFDFSNATNTLIFRSKEPIGFSLSADGWLAYSSRENENSEIYILHTQSIDQTPINITQSPTTFEYPLEWSPDGRYLAYVSNQDEMSELYIWNGSLSINITPQEMPDTPTSFSPTWNADGRLAFTVSFGYPPEDSPNEIYLWDGNATINLSQNPKGLDDEPFWNADGQVMFGSYVVNESYISVWDGVSFKDGSPKLDRLTYPTELRSAYSGLGWTPDGKLTGLIETAQDTHLQIYVWDGQTLLNVSQNPTQHNGNPEWGNDGQLAFTTFFSGPDLLYVRDAQNRPLLRTRAQYSPAWSPNGLLMFCNYGWKLSVWDGYKIIKLAQASEIEAKWSNGNGIFCSSG